MAADRDIFDSLTVGMKQIGDKDARVAVAEVIGTCTRRPSPAVTQNRFYTAPSVADESQALRRTLSLSLFYFASHGCEVLR